MLSLTEVGAAGGTGSSYPGSSKQKSSGMELQDRYVFKAARYTDALPGPLSAGARIWEIYESGCPVYHARASFTVAADHGGICAAQSYTQALNLLNKNVEINDNVFIFQGKLPQSALWAGSLRSGKRGGIYPRYDNND